MRLHDPFSGAVIDVNDEVSARYLAAGYVAEAKPKKASTKSSKSAE